MMTSITTYHWGMGTPEPARDRLCSQTVASSSLLCMWLWKAVIVEHTTECVMLYDQQLLCE